MEIFESLKDEELVALSRGGDHRAEEALILRYMSYVRSFARPYFLAGGDSEDIIQEGMIGVIKAIAEFDEAHHASFKTFSTMCIRNRIYSAIRYSMRDKNLPLNNYVSMGSVSGGGMSADDIPIVTDTPLDPVEQVIGEESYKELLGAASGILSKLEQKVLALYLEGLSYGEISEAVSKPQKSVDNAVQRIRRKFAQYFAERGNIG